MPSSFEVEASLLQVSAKARKRAHEPRLPPLRSVGLLAERRTVTNGPLRCSRTAGAGRRGTLPNGYGSPLQLPSSFAARTTAAAWHTADRPMTMTNDDNDDDEEDDEEEDDEDDDDDAGAEARAKVFQFPSQEQQ